LDKKSVRREFPTSRGKVTGGRGGGSKTSAEKEKGREEVSADVVRENILLEKPSGEKTGRLRKMPGN